MGDIGLLLAKILRWTLLGAVIFSLIFGLIVLINLAFSMIFVTLNGGVLGDIFSLIQLWLPFNLNVVLLWLTTGSIAYISYRLAVTAYNYVESITR